MFDRIIQPRGGAGQRSASVGVAVVAHGLLLLGVAYISTRAATSDQAPVEVTLFKTPPRPVPGPPPPPPPPKRRTTPRTTPTIVKPLEIVQPVSIPEPVAAEPEPAAEDEGGDEGEEGGEIGGVPGGVVGGVEGGVVGGQLGGEGTGDAPPIYLKAGMIKPTLPASCFPRIPDTLKAMRLRGTVMTRFVLGADGRVREVTILQSVPGLDSVVRESLLNCRMEPVQYDGRATAVYIIQSFRFESQ